MGHPSDVVIERKLLEEMRDVIADLYPSHPSLAKAQRVLDRTIADIYREQIATSDNILTGWTSSPQEDVELIIEQTPHEKFYGVIRAKAERSDKGLRGLADFYDISLAELNTLLAEKEPHKGSPFTLRSLRQYFNSSVGHWEEVNAICFGTRPNCS